MKSNLFVVLGAVAVGGVLWLQASCAEAPKGEAAAKPQAAMVRTLKLPEFDPVLPAGKGRETVMVMCAVCHTPHYILNQPPFPREVWMAEVTKMQKTYSAPIPDDQVPAIVEYLMAVRGPAGN